MTKNTLSSIAAFSMAIAFALLLLPGPALAQSCGPPCQPVAGAEALVDVRGTGVAPASGGAGILTRSSADSSAAAIAATSGGALVALALAQIGIRRWRALNLAASHPTALASAPHGPRTAAGKVARRRDERAHDGRSRVRTTVA